MTTTEMVKAAIEAAEKANPEACAKDPEFQITKYMVVTREIEDKLVAAARLYAPGKIPVSIYRQLETSALEAIAFINNAIKIQQEKGMFDEGAG